MQICGRRSSSQLLKGRRQEASWPCLTPPSTPAPSRSRAPPIHLILRPNSRAGYSSGCEPGAKTVAPKEQHRHCVKERMVDKLATALTFQATPQQPHSTIMRSTCAASHTAQQGCAGENPRYRRATLGLAALFRGPDKRGLGAMGRPETTPSRRAMQIARIIARLRPKLPRKGYSWDGD